MQHSGYRHLGKLGSRRGCNAYSRVWGTVHYNMCFERQKFSALLLVLRASMAGVPGWSVGPKPPNTHPYKVE